MGMQPANRITNARSQERLLGGKKPTIILHHQPLVQSASVQHPQQFLIQHQQNQQQLQQFQQIHQIQQLQQHQQHQHQNQQQEVIMIEKLKRNLMKTQATQTEVLLVNKQSHQHLSLSPRTIQRVSCG